MDPETEGEVPRYPTAARESATTSPDPLNGDAGARQAALWRLRQGRDPASAGVLAEVLRNDEAPAVRAAAARALGSVGGEDAVEALLQAEDDVAFVRTAVATSLGVLADPRAVGKLVAWLDDPATRTAAAEALGRIGDPAAVPALAALLEAGWEWRFSARDALIEHGHPDAVEALRGDRGLLRPLRVRAARRAVERRRGQAAGEVPRRLFSLPVWHAALAARELLLAALAVWLPVAIVDTDPRVVSVAAVAGVLMFALALVLARRDRQRRLDVARWRARPVSGRRAAPAVMAFAMALRLRPGRSLVLLAAAVGMEWATGGAGYAAGLLAGLTVAALGEHLLLGRLIARWQRRSGTRLLTVRGRFFSAPRGL